METGHVPLSPIKRYLWHGCDKRLSSAVLCLFFNVFEQINLGDPDARAYMEAFKPPTLDLAVYRFWGDTEQVRHLLLRHDIGLVFEQLDLVGLRHFGNVHDSSFCHFDATSFCPPAVWMGPSGYPTLPAVPNLG